MLKAIDTDIKKRVFFLVTAFFIPREISIGNTFVKKPFFFFFDILISLFPVTAFTGDTLEAFFAGIKDAIKTVKNPIIIPKLIPSILKLNINGSFS